MPSIPYCAEPDGARPCEASDIRDARMGIPYRAEPDGARPCEASDIRDARMGIPYRAEPDGARPCEASDIRDARMGIPFPFNKLEFSFSYSVQYQNSFYITIFKSF